jgi:hypothetical protein
MKIHLSQIKEYNTTVTHNFQLKPILAKHNKVPPQKHSPIPLPKK